MYSLLIKVARAVLTCYSGGQICTHLIYWTPELYSLVIAGGQSFTNLLKWRPELYSLVLVKARAVLICYSEGQSCYTQLL